MKYNGGYWEKEEQQKLYMRKPGRQVLLRNLIDKNTKAHNAWGTPLRSDPRKY